jgi:DNA mismatch repair ATPase MutS
VANDEGMAEFKRVHILTGPNASGKSTLLVTVSQLVFLAHAVCSVPATSASLPELKNMFWAREREFRGGSVHE